MSSVSSTGIVAEAHRVMHTLPCDTRRTPALDSCSLLIAKGGLQKQAPVWDLEDMEVNKVHAAAQNILQEQVKHFCYAATGHSYD